MHVMAQHDSADNYKYVSALDSFYILKCIKTVPSYIARLTMAIIQQ